MSSEDTVPAAAPEALDRYHIAILAELQRDASRTRNSRSASGCRPRRRGGA
jgi:hypothetical protein